MLLQLQLVLLLRDPRAPALDWKRCRVGTIASRSNTRLPPRLPRVAQLLRAVAETTATRAALSSPMGARRTHTNSIANIENPFEEEEATTSMVRWAERSMLMAEI